MQLPYFSPNWVGAQEPIWEGSLEESSSATLLGPGMSPSVARCGLVIATEWKEHLRSAVPLWSCWRFLRRRFIPPPPRLNKSIRTRRRLGDSSCLHLFWACFFRGPSPSLGRRQRRLFHAVVHSSQWHTTSPSAHRAPFSAYIPFSSGRRARYLAREASPEDGDASRCPDLTSASPPLQLLNLAIYGSHFLPSRSWRSKRCKCQSVSP